MSITFVKPENWNMVPPGERKAGGRAKLHGMHVSAENPFMILLEEPPNTYTSVHSHSEPEVMVVLEGHITFNGEVCKAQLFLCRPTQITGMRPVQNDVCLASYGPRRGQPGTQKRRLLAKPDAERLAKLQLSNFLEPSRFEELLDKPGIMSTNPLSALGAQ
jgi:hypothetical protein